MNQKFAKKYRSIGRFVNKYTYIINSRIMTDYRHTPIVITLDDTFQGIGERFFKRK